MEQYFRHMSIRGRMAFATLVPLVIAAGALLLTWTAPEGDTNQRLLSGALLFTAFGGALVLLGANVRSVVRPLEEARRVTQALARGDYDQRARVERLDEVGHLLVALDGLGDYLAVMLPEEAEQKASKPTGTRLPQRVAPLPDALEAIARRLQPVDHAEAVPLPTSRLRLVARQG